MLQILGNPKRCCDGLCRRDFLQVATFGLGSVAASPLLPQPAARGRETRSAKAKSVLVLFLYGAPSQMDTFDPKPDASVETRGEFKTIPTRIPSVRIAEHLPRIAGLLDRVTLVRSLTHPYPTHAVAYALSVVPISEPAIEANAKEPRHSPYFGSVLDYLWSRGSAPSPPGLPRNLYLPWPLNSRTKNKMHGALHAAWLGEAFDPVIPEFVGQASRAQGAPSAEDGRAIRSRFDPFDGITPESTFRFGGTQPLPDITLDRLNRRHSLVQQLDQQARRLEGPMRHFSRLQQAAFDLLTSAKVSQALDVTREPPRVRERYGYTLFGQGVLAARRLIEAGARVVTVFWDEYGPVNTAWDTHANNFPRLKEGLCPTLDQVYPTLLEDLEQRGLLDETLVLLISEHGRTPKLSNVPGGGREHWAYAYGGLLAGAGIQRGAVIGATDRQGGYPIHHPLNPKDIPATAYHLLGFDPQTTTTPDRLGRPMPLLPYGNVISEILA
jgi:hypothetical protein